MIRLRTLLIVVLGVGLIAGAYWLYLRLQHTREPTVAVLRIDSLPTGAEVWVAGQQLGQTPLVVENNYEPKDYEVVVRKHGFQAWRGVFYGGVSTRFDAHLSRQR
jgi:hypothetical protein